VTDPTLSETEVAGGSWTDPLAEAARVLAAAKQHGVTLRATGGVAVALLCESARRPPLSRSYQDIDFAMRSRDADAAERLFAELGYEPEEEFNVLHGQHRMFFTDRAQDRQADVFLDRIEMCHTLELGDRLERVEQTLTPADLLLSKLQVVETNQKDYLDMVALLSDLPLTERDDRGIDLVRIREICGGDWGWWKTATIVGGRVKQFAEELCSRNSEVDAAVVGHVETLLEDLERTPKSRKWKLRARVGERVKWHEQPEDIDHEADNE
jgi:Uncharacterised nucleotidyltransferase